MNFNVLLAQQQLLVWGKSQWFFKQNFKRIYSVQFHMIIIRHGGLVGNVLAY